VIVAFPIAAGLIVTTIVIHYEALRVLSAMVARSPRPPRFRILVVVLGCFAAHVVEIVVYALAYFAIEHVGIGAFRGELHGSFEDALYFSATTYSTLGIGDVYPKGAIRLIAGFEAVNGLFLIAWSTSFTYLAMERLWPLHSRITVDEDQK
jgi:hypothetical protein